MHNDPAAQPQHEVESVSRDHANSDGERRPGFPEKKGLDCPCKTLRTTLVLLSDSAAAFAGIRTSDRENGWASGYSCELLVWPPHVPH
jgi:hypothetical protein